MGPSYPMKNSPSVPYPVILFDRVCNLCSGSVQFIIKRDPSARFRFASLQSDFGNQILQNLNLSTTSFHSIILLTEKGVLQRSDAALEIARYLTGLWPAFYALKIIPSFLRDPVYDWISRNRYRWFGKKEFCWIPSPDLKSRFLDQ
jgi:predicted DCC family thiol-disulfide oxidoreductase YuxK